MRPGNRCTKDNKGVYRHLYVAVSFLCVCLLLAACRKEDIEQETKPVRTLLVYMCGDNNLSGEVVERIGQIRATQIPPGARLLLFYDTKGEEPVLSEMVCKNGKNELIIIRHYNECNTADTVFFGTLLREVSTLYPSDSYGLLFFSHASGWMPEQTYKEPALRSVGMDNNSEMELSAFAGALPSGMFDFIIFEACHMAGIEVAWELKDKTSYIIASSAEIVSPGFYSHLL